MTDDIIKLEAYTEYAIRNANAFFQEGDYQEAINSLKNAEHYMVSLSALTKNEDERE